MFWVAVVVAVSPIVIASVQALTHHWSPVGDDALLTLRAIDVFSAHPPLLGSGTSAQAWSGLLVNNIGPLQFWLLAVPVRVLGPSVGVVAGTAAMNSASVLVVAWCARRRGGVGLALASMLGILLLEAAMGPNLLFEMWQPYATILPFAALLFAAWSVAADDLAALPFVVVFGSFLVQSHLSYVELVPAVAPVAFAWLAVGRFRSRAGEGGVDGSAYRKRFVTWAGACTGLALVLWAPTIYQQLFQRPGNLSQLAKASVVHGGGAPLGVVQSTRDVAAVVALPPYWFGSGFRHTTFPSTALTPYRTGEAVGLGALGVVVAVLVAIATLGLRRRDRLAASGAVVAILGIIGGIASGAQAHSPFGSIGAYVRWLWPLSLFVWLQIGWSAWRLARALVGDRVRHVAVARRSALGVGVAAAIVVAFTVHATSYRGTDEVVALRRSSTYLADRAVPKLKHLGPLALHRDFDLIGVDQDATLMMGLADAGVTFYTDHAGLQTQIGNSRILGNHPTRSTVWFESGVKALTVPPGVTRLALYQGLSPTLARELQALRDRYQQSLVDDPPITAEVRAEFERSHPGALASVRHASDPIAALLAILEANPRMIDIRDPRIRYLVLMNSLIGKRNAATIGVFVAPTGSAGAPHIAGAVPLAMSHR